MKFARSNDKHKVRATVDMTPIIDVVFQLLIFFMLTSSFVVQSSIPIEMPEVPEGGTELEKKDLTITLAHGEGGPDNQGKIYFMIDESIEVSSWEEFDTLLREHYKESPDEIIRVEADKRVTTQRLVYVLSQLNAVGFTKYGLAAESPAAGE